MTPQLKRLLLDGGILVLVLGILGGVAALIWASRVDQNKVEAVVSQRVIFQGEVGGKIPVPYFLLVFDRSLSMKKSDPQNHERSSAQFVLDHIYAFSGKIHESIGQYPRIKLVGFSDTPQPLGSDQGWMVLDSPSALEKARMMVDENLENDDRNGWFTDINAVADFSANSEIPAAVGDLPTRLVTIMFTDGRLDPNALNRVSHRTDADWRDALNQVESLLRKYHLDMPFNAHLASEMAKNNRSNIDLPIWLAECVKKGQIAQSQSTKILQAFRDGVNRNHFNNNTIFLGQDLQKSIFGEMAKRNISFNIIGLFENPEASVDGYLDRWVKLDDQSPRLGFYRQISSSQDLGEQITNLMTSHLNADMSRMTVAANRTFGPFGGDVDAFSLTVIPAAGNQAATAALPPDVIDRFVSLTGPSGQLVPAQSGTTGNMRMYLVKAKDFPDFHERAGWTLKVNPTEYNGVKLTEASVLAVEFYTFSLTFDLYQETDETGQTTYAARLVSAGSNEVVGMKEFENPPAVTVIPKNPGDCPPVQTAPFEEGVLATFPGWPTGRHDVQVTMTGGRLKGDSADLRERQVDVQVEIGRRVWITEGERRIDAIHLSPVKR